jgi:excisionase family DNA binding protein
VPAQTQITKRLYSLRESAVYLALSVDTLRDIIAAGQIPVHQRGPRGKMYLDIVDLDQFIEIHKTVRGPSS